MHFMNDEHIRVWVYSIGATILISAVPCFFLLFIPIRVIYLFFKYTVKMFRIVLRKTDHILKFCWLLVQVDFWGMPFFI